LVKFKKYFLAARIKFLLGKPVLVILLFFLMVCFAFCSENTAFHQILRQRRTIRHFQQKEIPLEVLKVCLEDAILAPSAMNRQPWQFILVQNSDLRKKIFKHLYWLAQDRPAAEEAPAAYLVLLAPGQQNSFSVDLAFAAANFINAAWAEGIGCCLIGSCDRPPLKKLLRIPKSKEIFLVIACGYPAPGKIPRAVTEGKGTEPYLKKNILLVPKKSLPEVLFIDYFGKKF
jgi:nitroreductase